MLMKKNKETAGENCKKSSVPFFKGTEPDIFNRQTQWRLEKIRGTFKSSASGEII
jgi:hypothetical protein